MGRGIPAVHAGKHRLCLVQHQHGPFGNEFELGVGDHDRDLEHAVGIRIQSGHFHVDPYEIVLAVALAAGRGLLRGL